MDLLDVFAYLVRACLSGRAGNRFLVATRGNSSKVLLGPAQHVLRIYVARNSEQNIVAPVAAVQVACEILALEATHRLLRSDNRFPKRMVAPAVFEMKLVHVVARLVLAPL